jgi:hypothetical protein
MQRFLSQVADTPVWVYYDARHRIVKVETVEDDRPLHLGPTEIEELTARIVRV